MATPNDFDPTTYSDTSDTVKDDRSIDDPTLLAALGIIGYDELDDYDVNLDPAGGFVSGREDNIMDAIERLHARATDLLDRISITLEQTALDEDPLQVQRLLQAQHHTRCACNALCAMVETPPEDKA